KQKNKNLFLKSSQFKIVHGDFHWGNIIKDKDQIRIIDFGYAFAGDKFEDVGGFLAQNDSMFRYYAPNFITRAEKIRRLFLKSYFSSPGGPTAEENRHLLYFEIQKILEMAAILSFVESNQEYKDRGLTKLLLEAKTKLKLLK
ncbi:phosphotransferase, partial [Patescibacteria group bacterium]|nr:phosphotransferase [Patescibacteria group bacterium]